MRTLHQHQTFNTQHSNKTCSLRCALYIISQHSTLNNQAKHVPSDAHFASTPNIQHSTTKQNMFPQMRTLHQHQTFNTQHSNKTCSLRCALCILWRIIFMKKNNYLREKKYFSGLYDKSVLILAAFSLM